MRGLPVVAIVGRPNVGKSTLFNRIVGGRPAIVEDRAGTTRDRIYGEGEWNGRTFALVDTGGLEETPGSPLEAAVQQQARLAIEEADLIVLVVDATSGLTPSDEEAAQVLRKAPGRVFVAMNKADNDARELAAGEFYQLGWEDCYPISAAHGRGTGDLLDAIVDALPPISEAERIAADRAAREEALADEFVEEVAAGEATGGEVGGQEVELEAGDIEPIDGIEADVLLGPVTIALVGRPNVGKSSLLNALASEQRSIVSDIPGTTRDAIDTRIDWAGGEVILVDTAGIRKRGRVAGGSDTDRYSTLRAFRAIDRADVAVLIVDAVEGLTAQDEHIAGYVVEQGRGLVVAVNKWDLVASKTDRTFDQYVTWIRKEAPFLDFAPVVSLSAKTGQRVERVLELAVEVWGERRRRIGTGELNRLLADATVRQPPPAVKGRRPKLFYATQVGIAPPTFVFFARDAGSVHFSYRRFLENQLRGVLGFTGTPVRLIFRERSSAPRPRTGGRPGGARSRSGARTPTAGRSRPGGRSSASRSRG